MGGKTQWVGLIAAALTIIFLLFLTPLLAPLPTVALGAIIIVASLGLIDIAAFRFLRQVRPAEFWLAVVTAFGVLTVGVLAGILVAVVLSLIIVLYHISRPHDALLDDVDAAGGTVYRGVTDKETALTEPGLIVYRFDAPLVFANAAFFTERLEALIANAGADLKCVILDAEAHQRFRFDGGGGAGESGCGPGTARRRLVDCAREWTAAPPLESDGTDETAWQGQSLSVGARRGGGVSRTTCPRIYCIDALSWAANLRRLSCHIIRNRKDHNVQKDKNSAYFQRSRHIRPRAAADAQPGFPGRLPGRAAVRRHLPAEVAPGWSCAEPTAPLRSASSAKRLDR